MTFYKYSYNDGLFLYSDEAEEIYRIKWHTELLDDYQTFAESRGDGTVYYVSCIFNEKANEPYYDIKALRDEYGTTYFETDEYYEIETKDAFATLIFFSAISVLVICYIILSVNVARHPGKFKRKTVDLFFKPGYIKDYSRK